MSLCAGEFYKIRNRLSDKIALRIAEKYQSRFIC
jgi:hypothetical protein